MVQANEKRNRIPRTANNAIQKFLVVKASPSFENQKQLKTALTYCRNLVYVKKTFLCSF